MSDDDRNAILSRRKRLIQSALVAAGLSLAPAGCDDPSDPVVEEDTAAADADAQVCLGVPADTSDDSANDTTTDAAPEVCLEPPVDIVEDTPDATDTTDDAADDDTAAPEVCLSPPAPDIADDTPDSTG